MNISLSIDQIIGAKLHIGHTNKFFNVQLKSILLGFRFKVSILDITYSIWQFQIISNLVTKLMSKRHFLLIIKDWNFFYVNKYMKSVDKICVHDTKWIGGLLTNYKSIFYKRLNSNLSLSNFLKKKRYPSIIFLFDTNASKWALFESFNLGIPTVSLVDSDSLYFKSITYPVVGNNKNIDAILLYLLVIKNSALLGFRQEIVRVLYLQEFLSSKNKKDRTRKKNIIKIRSLRKKYKSTIFSLKLNKYKLLLINYRYAKKKTI